jgi:hypothetical protein
MLGEDQAIGNVLLQVQIIFATMVRPYSDNQFAYCLK